MLTAAVPSSAALAAEPVCVRRRRRAPAVRHILLRPARGSAAQWAVGGMAANNERSPACAGLLCDRAVLPGDSYVLGSVGEAYGADPRDHRGEVRRCLRRLRHGRPRAPGVACQLQVIGGFAVAFRHLLRVAGADRLVGPAEVSRAGVLRLYGCQRELRQRRACHLRTRDRDGDPFGRAGLHDLVLDQVPFTVGAAVVGVVVRAREHDHAFASAEGFAVVFTADCRLVADRLSL
jgi:hypothetical protein